MKKLLGISLVAVLAATPLMAMADPVGTGTTPAHYTPADDSDTGSSVTASTTPKYQLMAAHDNDVNAATAGYVKGAYNAAIKAVNAVHDEVATLDSDKQDALTAGDGINIDANTDAISVDLTTNGGLEIDSNHQLGVKAGDGITVDSTGVKLTNGIQGATATDTYTGTGLTTQGYVDEAVAGAISSINTTLEGYATQEGVTQTITDSTITITDGKTVSTSLSGVNGITASTTVPIMNTWGSDVPASTPLAATTTVDASSLGVSSTLGGSITASITGATYAEPSN